MTSARLALSPGFTSMTSHICRHPNATFPPAFMYGLKLNAKKHFFIFFLPCLEVCPLRWSNDDHLSSFYPRTANNFPKHGDERRPLWGEKTAFVLFYLHGEFGRKGDEQQSRIATDRLIRWGPHKEAERVGDKFVLGWRREWGGEIEERRGEECLCVSQRMLLQTKKGVETEWKSYGDL